MADRYDLQRFLDAQEGEYELACNELRAGQKRSHWMWFIFPQIQGLGHSATAQHFAISGREEALAYLNHPVLGTRLRECTQLVDAIEGRTAEQIFGYPDYLKFRSSMTLFSLVGSDRQVFLDALAKYFDAEPDKLTVARL